MSRADNHKTLVRLPLVNVKRAYESINTAPLSVYSKIEAIDWLVDHVDCGFVTIGDVITAGQGLTYAPVNHGMHSEVTTPAAAAALAKSAGDAVAAAGNAAAAAAVANRAETLALDAAAKTAALDKYVADTRADTLVEITRLSGLLEKMQQAQDSQVNAAAVAVAVSDAVADAFKPFENAVRAAGAEAIVGDMVATRIVDSRTALDVFGVTVVDYLNDDVMVDIWNDAAAPAIDPCFIWTADILKSLLLADDQGLNIWLGGEKGSGKSETARQFAARTGRAYTRINFHKHTSSEDYVGAVGLVAGATQFVKGDFLHAFTSPSTVILLDEVTNCSAGELAPLNGFLEAGSAVSWGGAVHRRAAGVMVMAADNTLGSGDDSGRYTGTGTMNSALVDRFALIIPFSFLPIDVEINAVMRHTGCTYDLASHVMLAICAARAKVQTGDIVDAPSIRSVIAFIKALKRHSVADAWTLCVASRQPSEGAAALAAIYAACISVDYVTDHI